MSGLQNEQSHQTVQNGGFGKIILADSSNNQQSNKAVQLSQEQIDGLLKCLPSRASQARRFVKFLANNPNANTAECNAAALAVNLSDLAIKYNPYLKGSGYEIRCRLPERLIKNRLNEPTMMHLYGLFELGVTNA